MRCKLRLYVQRIDLKEIYEFFPNQAASLTQKPNKVVHEPPSHTDLVEVSFRAVQRHSNGGVLESRK